MMIIIYKNAHIHFFFDICKAARKVYIVRIWLKNKHVVNT